MWSERLNANPERLDGVERSISGACEMLILSGAEGTRTPDPHTASRDRPTLGGPAIAGIGRILGAPVVSFGAGGRRSMSLRAGGFSNFAPPLISVRTAGLPTSVEAIGQKPQDPAGRFGRSTVRPRHHRGGSNFSVAQAGIQA